MNIFIIQNTKVIVNITPPTSPYLSLNISFALRAKANAIAPLNPENHKKN